MPTTGIVQVAKTAASEEFEKRMPWSVAISPSEGRWAA